MWIAETPFSSAWTYSLEVITLRVWQATNDIDKGYAYGIYGLNCYLSKPDDYKSTPKEAMVACCVLAYEYLSKLRDQTIGAYTEVKHNGT